MGISDILSIGTEKQYSASPISLNSYFDKEMNNIYSLFSVQNKATYTTPTINTDIVLCINTNSTDRTEGTINQESKDEKTGQQYKQTIREICNELKEQKISKSEFCEKFAKLTESDIKTRILKTIPQIKKSLNQDDINNLKSIFSYECNLIHAQFGAVDNDNILNDKDKIEILQKLLENNEKLLENCLEVLPSLDISSKIEYVKQFMLLDKNIRITAASIINHSTTLTAEEKTKSLNIFGKTFEERKHLALQNENRIINKIINKDKKLEPRDIYPFFGFEYYNYIVNQ